MRYLHLPIAKIEGMFGQFDTTDSPDFTAEQMLAWQKEREEIEREDASLTEFAKKWAHEINPGEAYYEVSHRDLVKDIMKIEAALREELSHG